MTTATPAEIEFSFLEEGFSARDIVEQKINESSMTVSVLCDKCHPDETECNRNLTLYDCIVLLLHSVCYLEWIM